MYNKDNFFGILEQAGVSNSTLAKAIGVSTGNVSDWKNGKSKPNINAICNIAQYLKCSTDYLLDNETPQTDEQGSFDTTHERLQDKHNTFWDRFYDLCEQHGTKPNRVAEELNISSGVLSRWKNGNTPNSELLTKISNYFHCSTDYLLGNTTFPQSPEFYRTLLSDKGIRAIKTELSDIIASVTKDELADRLGVDFTDISKFIALDSPYDHKLLSMLDKVLVALDVNLYDLLLRNFFRELQNSDSTIYIAARTDVQGLPQLVNSDLSKKLSKMSELTDENDL